jgi:lipopolysaccharide export system protein LptC
MQAASDDSAPRIERQPMTSTVDGLGTRGFSASSRPNNQQIFLRAQRHSRRVRMLRVAVPAGTAAVLAVFTLVSWLDPTRIISRLPTADGQLVISGTKITMSSPRLSGFSKDSRPYELNARSAAQDITNPDFVELTDIYAKIESKDRTPIIVTAVDGLYNRKSGILKLNRDIVLQTPSYQVDLIEAVVDTANNNVVSDKPVQVKMLQGTVNSKRLEVTGGGEVIRFVGDVKMTLQNMPELNPMAAQRR